MIDEGPIEALAAWGAAPEVIAEWRRDLMQQAKEQAIEIWPEHWHAWCVFVGMGTQWRTAPAGFGVAWIGLDYAALPIVLAEHRGAAHRQPLVDLMPQLRVLERAAVLQMMASD